MVHIEFSFVHHIKNKQCRQKINTRSYLIKLYLNVNFDRGADKLWKVIFFQCLFNIVEFVCFFMYIPRYVYTFLTSLKGVFAFKIKKHFLSFFFQTLLYLFKKLFLQKCWFNIYIHNFTREFSYHRENARQWCETSFNRRSISRNGYLSKSPAT